MSGQLVDIIAIILTALSVPISLLAAKAVGKLCAYIDAKTSVWDADADKAKKQALAQRVCDVASATALEMQLSLINGMKEKSEDGKLSATDAKAAARAALTTLQNLAGPIGLREADAVLGDSSEWLRALLEAKVDELKGDK